MTKKELVEAVRKDTHLSAKAINEVVEKALSTIKQQLAAGDEVVFRNFGTFKMKHRAEKRARDITRGTEVIIPAMDVPTFKASKTFLNN